MIASSQGVTKDTQNKRNRCSNMSSMQKTDDKVHSISVRNFIVFLFEINVEISFYSCSKSMPNLPVRNQCQWLIGFPFEISVKRIESTPHLFRNQYQNLIEFLFEINAKPSCSKSMSIAHCIPVQTQCQTRHRHRLQCSLHCHLNRHVWPIISRWCRENTSRRVRSMELHILLL